MPGPNLRHVYEVYIRTTPTKLWRAITNYEVTSRYFYGHGLKSTLRKGASLEYVHPKTGAKVIVGRILDIVPRKRLVHTFSFVHRSGEGDRPSRVTYELEKKASVMKLTVIHDRFNGPTPTYKSVATGWNPILSGLKTLLETGTLLFKN